jgi:UDP-sugar diphosphatase
MKNLQIDNLSCTELKNPKFVKPIRINYIQNSIEKTWEAVKSYDSVSVLLYHKTKNAFLIVKQFRPAVFINDNTHKVTYELCAGIIDKDLSLSQILKEEIDEECGYDVQLQDITKITSFFTNVGVSGAKQYMYFATIDDSIKIHSGGGINDEYIELEYISVDNAKKFIFDETKAKTPGIMFAFYWFFDNFD